MKWILGLLNGGGGIWVLIGGLLAASAAGATGGYIARGVIDAPQIAGARLATAEANTRTQACIASHETDRANGNAKVVGELTTQIATLRGIVADLQKKALARDAADVRFQKALANVPKTSVCGGSPAERVYRDSVQPSGPAVAP